MTNEYCETLGIDVPSVEQAKASRDANVYALLITALLERGKPMTLPEVAERFEVAGIAPSADALRSLKRCQPARAPVYRDGDLYALDPHDAQLSLWALRLGLRPPAGPRISVARPEPQPLPGPEQPLTIAELDEAWADSGLSGWSSTRLALCVLDANGEPMAPAAVVAFVGARTEWALLSPDSAKFKARTSKVRVLEDGRWGINDVPDVLLAARKAVRDRIRKLRQSTAPRIDPAVFNALDKARKRREDKVAAELAALRRILVHAFPAEKPQVVVLLDINRREIETYFHDQFDTMRERLGEYGYIAAVNVRSVLRALGFDAGSRRFAELGPPQKTRVLNKRGRKLKITVELLTQASCGITRPFGDVKKLAGYLREGKTGQLQRRLEADARSLFALYRYGMLHGAVRLRWGSLDEMIPAPWCHQAEPTLYHLMRQAHEEAAALQVVFDTAPSWADPWARSRRCHARLGANRYDLMLVDEVGCVFDELDAQAARIASEPDRPFLVR